jgi:hypothetical protein
MRSSLSLAVPVALVAFFAGAGASGISQAQSNPLASTIYVPADGLVFRTFDGRVIAKLSHDARGGALEVFDDHERLFATFRNEGKPGPFPIGAAPADPPRCDPPFRFDAEGTKHFLRECF